MECNEVGYMIRLGRCFKPPHLQNDAQAKEPEQRPPPTLCAIQLMIQLRTLRELGRF